MSTGLVWVVSELYYPEEAATGHFLTGIAEGLGQRFPVRVLCGQPTYAARGTRSPWRERRNAVDIVRCRATTLDKDVLPFRLVNAATLTASVLLAGLRRFRRGDVVLVVTNPPTLPYAVALACRLRGARAVLIVHDVYPEALAVAGMRSRIVLSLLRWASGRLYRAMDAIVVLGRDMARLVATRLGPGAPAPVVIPNWADLEEVGPDREAGAALRDRVGIAARFVVGYAGNIGRTHDLGTLVAAAEMLRGEPDIHVLIAGAGAGAPALRRDIEARGLDNATLLPPVPRAELRGLLNAADVAVVALRPGMAGVSVPSRIYNLLACGRPIIALAEQASELAAVVTEEDVGWVVTPGDATGLAAAIREASTDPARLTAIGDRALQAAQRYSRARAIDGYADLVNRLR